MVIHRRPHEPDRSSSPTSVPRGRPTYFRSLDAIRTGARLLLTATGHAILAAVPSCNRRGFLGRLTTTGAAALFLCDEECATSECESQSEQCDFFHGEDSGTVFQVRGRRKRRVNGHSRIASLGRT